MTRSPQPKLVLEYLHSVPAAAEDYGFGQATIGPRVWHGVNAVQANGRRRTERVGRHRLQRGASMCPQAMREIVPSQKLVRSAALPNVHRDGRL